MLQKTLFGNIPVPAIWQGGGKITTSDFNTQVQVWADGVRYGCNAIDTAELYGNGRSELMVGEVIKKVGRKDILISTKVSAEHMRYHDVIHACEQSLKRMGTDYIDFYHVWWSNPNVPIEDTIAGMLHLRDTGKIKYIGICNYTPDQIYEVDGLLDSKLASIQLEYNMFNRIHEHDLIPYCNDSQKLFLAYSPLNNGQLIFQNHTLKNMSRKYNRTISQVVLNFLTKKHNVSVLPKASTTEHMIQNAQATEFVIDDADYDVLAGAIGYTIRKLKPSDIMCVRTGGGAEMSYDVYKTIDEARENKNKLTPSPVDIARELHTTGQLSRPVQIERHNGENHLVDGNVRYWAWVIAFGWDREIECVIVSEN